MKRMWSKNELKEISKQLIESGLIENAKPIYFHPCFVRDNGENTWARITFIILDNNSTAYTWSTFKAKLKELLDAGAAIQINGVFQEKTTEDHAYCQAFILLKIDADYKLYGVTPDGTQYHISLDSITASVFDDGVNKIN